MVIDGWGGFFCFFFTWGCGAFFFYGPLCHNVRPWGARGGYVLGVCNGFQILCETGLLPGALIRNASLHFICKPQKLRVEPSPSAFTRPYADHPIIDIPIAHHDGNYVADTPVLDALEGDGRIAFRYIDNPNGSARDIAGIFSENGRILGMMPHPERAIGAHEGGDHGRLLFDGLMAI